jgi:hypothetical protein
MMVMRRKRERIHRETTVSQALMIVNGKFAQIVFDIWPWSLVDLLEVIEPPWPALIFPAPAS